MMHTFISICFIHSLLNNNLKIVGVNYHNPTNVSFEILQFEALVINNTPI